MNLDTERQPFKMSPPITRAAPANLEDVAFWPVTALAQLVRSRKVRSLDLTRMYLERLKKYDPLLQCVITLTEDLALGQAQAADREIGAGRYRGPLHGIPWGAKDLLATRRYKTTWGAAPYKDQVLDHDPTIVERLEEAGAVLVAKLSTGELAAGDIWFGGQTKNSWNLQEGDHGFFGRTGCSHSSRPGGVFHWHRDPRFHCFSIHSMRTVRTAPHLRPGQPIRGHAHQFQHGQARPHVPERGRLRPGLRCHLWT